MLGLLVAVASLDATRRLESTGTVVVAYRLSSSKAYGLLPRPGIGPMFLALAGGFLTTGPQRKLILYCVVEKGRKRMAN